MAARAPDPALDLAWQRDGWQARAADGRVFPLAGEAIRRIAAADEAAPGRELPAPDAPVRCLWLPVEWVAPKPFSLPVAHPRFLDTAVIAGEWEEAIGEDAAHLWLAWCAARAGAEEGAKGEAGVAGLMAAMPEAWREALDALAPLSHVRIDALDRLEQRRREGAPLPGGEAVAVLDADAEGVCFGVWQGAKEGGFWRGASRLNDAASGGPAGEDAREWLRAALAAMGWREGGPVIGRLDAARAAWFADFGGERGEALPARAAATLDAGAALLASGAAGGGIEFRHGAWAARASLAGLQRWRGAALLAGLALALWTGGMAWENHRLHQRIEAAQARIEAAFARALPGQPVIDALAQLRQAAGGNAAGSGATRRWLAAMDALARVFAEEPWTIHELEWRDGGMRMRGEVKDLQALNRLRERLAKALGRQMRLDDTELGKDRVGFRMAWS